MTKMMEFPRNRKSEMMMTKTMTMRKKTKMKMRRMRMMMKTRRMRMKTYVSSQIRPKIWSKLRTWIQRSRRRIQMLKLEIPLTQIASRRMTFQNYLTGTW